MSFVVDASVAIKWFVRETLHEPALDVLEARARIHAPDLIIAEVTNTAWKKSVRNEIPRIQAEAIAAAIRGYVQHLQASEALIERALAIAFTLNHAVYDCLYIAGAERIGSFLVTADQRLLNKTAGTAFETRIVHLENPGLSGLISSPSL